MYETKDGLRIKDKDYVLIHSHTDVSVDISNIGPSAVDIISYNGNNIITKEDLDRTVAQINERIDDAITAIEDLDTKLTEEIARAGQAEDALSGEIDNALTAINAVKNLVENETTRAIGVEDTLSGKIDDALTAITSLDTRLTEEITRAVQTEGILNAGINEALTAVTSERRRA